MVRPVLSHFAAFLYPTFLYPTVLYLVWIVGGAGVAAGAIYGLALALPALAVTVRRLYDTDRTAW